MDNWDEWNLSLAQAEQALVPGEILKLQRKLVFLTLGAAVEVSPGQYRRVSGVVLLTPVDTGRARSSWNVSVGQPDPTWPTGAIPPPASAASAAGVLAGLGVYETVWIASGLPYIKVLEYGGYPNPVLLGSWDKRTRTWIVKSEGGYSKQAPRGMVRITVEGIRAALGAG